MKKTTAFFAYTASKDGGGVVAAFRSSGYTLKENETAAPTSTPKKIEGSKPLSKVDMEKLQKVLKEEVNSRPGFSEYN